MPKIYIIIPTYNEKDNIPTLLEQIFSLAIEDLNVLVVDDNSPDGTGGVVDKLRQNNLCLQVLHRGQKDGLGPAYVAGFKEVLKQGADYICQMDADWSHQPKYIPDLLAAVKNYDLVLGSRYITGGGVSNWNLARRLVSRFGNLYARLILGLPICDLTGGFRCYRRQVLEKINLDNVSSIGYNFQIEIAYRVYQAGFKIKEIPIVFVERASGKSKFDLKIMLESFYKVILLRFTRQV